MNVNRIDESQKRLNYYSRSSPKKKKNTFYQHSPLLNFTHRHNHNASINNSRHISQSHNHSSIKVEIHQRFPFKTNEQILIQQCNSQDILIDDPSSQDSTDTRAVITDIKTQIYHQNNKSNSQNTQQPRQIKASEMRIQDDYEFGQEEEEDKEKQVSYFNLQQVNKDNKDAYIKIQNQQQPTMNRQFTFADSPLYWIMSPFLPIPYEQEQYLQQDISQQLSNQFHSDVLYFQSNMEYQIVESMKKIDVEEEFVKMSLRRMEDRWITSQDYNLLSPEKTNQILIEQANQSNKPQRGNSSILMRPYGNSIVLLNEIMPQIPQYLLKTYNSISTKLIRDQIKIEQQLKRQQQKIKITKMLVNLRKKGLKCQNYLLSTSANTQQQIQINQIVIHSLIKQIITQFK